MIVARYIAKFLREIGVTHVFGYDGSMMLKIADEISYEQGINFYQGFHEQASSFAADAFARVTGKMGTVLVTSGPGAINALGGCGDAFMDSVPLLLITGQDRYTHIASNPGVRLNGFQDLDIVSIAKPITKYAVQLQNAEDVAYELEKCVYIASEGRKGPVLLDVPMDIQFDDVPGELKHFDVPANVPALDTYTADRILEKIYQAERPVILAGGGIRLAGAADELMALAKITDIPIVTTLNGHDACSASLGSTGLYGLPEANLALYNCDVLLCLGARLGIQQTGKFKNEYTKGTILHVDIDRKEFGRAVSPQIALCCDVKDFLQYILKTIQPKSLWAYDAWQSRIKVWKEKYKDDLHVNTEGVDPVKLVREIGLLCPDDAIFTNDVGQNTMWVCQGLEPKGQQRLLTSSGYASMGFSLPAAIGATMAKPDVRVVSFSGDGGFHMNLQELQFVKLHRLNIKFVVFNNNTLGMMREVQRLYYHDNYVGSNENEFVCVDLAKVADLYDLGYVQVASEEDFSLLSVALDSPKATIIDIVMPQDTYLRNWYDFKKDYADEFV